jgi:uridylate kinase
MKKAKYKRVLLKLSGEAFKGDRDYGIDPKFLNYLAKEIKQGYDLGVEMGIVIGGGNIFRGMAAAANGLDRVTADYMGMLATVMNALAMQKSLEDIGVISRIQTSIEMKAIAEPFILLKALRHLEKKRVVLFAGGTGHPYFTTDTTAALRAVEIKAEAVFKATKVDGVYDTDPMKNPKAKKYNAIKYMDVLKKKLKVMDSTAVSLCMENKLEIGVFNLYKKGNIKKVLCGEKIGTFVTE